MNGMEFDVELSINSSLKIMRRKFQTNLSHQRNDMFDRYTIKREMMIEASLFHRMVP